jgi:hypothetical protein
MSALEKMLAPLVVVGAIAHIVLLARHNYDGKTHLFLYFAIGAVIALILAAVLRNRPVHLKHKSMACMNAFFLWPTTYNQSAYRKRST